MSSRSVVRPTRRSPSRRKRLSSKRITFTGATSTGRAVLRAAAENLTYATMELGGKNALIVLDDADMDTAVSVAVEGMFYNQGEACTSTARLLVHSSRYDEFQAHLKRLVKVSCDRDQVPAAFREKLRQILS